MYRLLAPQLAKRLAGEAQSRVASLVRHSPQCIMELLMYCMHRYMFKHSILFRLGGLQRCTEGSFSGESATPCSHGLAGGLPLHNAI